MIRKHEKKLALEQAYTAAHIFLDKQYSKTLSDDLGTMLGRMSTLEDDIPVDSAVWIDWAVAVSTVLGETCINKVMNPVIDSWKQQNLDVDITVNGKRALFITAKKYPTHAILILKDIVLVLLNYNQLQILCCPSFLNYVDTKKSFLGYPMPQD